MQYTHRFWILIANETSVNSKCHSTRWNSLKITKPVVSNLRTVCSGSGIITTPAPNTDDACVAIVSFNTPFLHLITPAGWFAESVFAESQFDALSATASSILLWNFQSSCDPHMSAWLFVHPVWSGVRVAHNAAAWPPQTKWRFTVSVWTGEAIEFIGGFDGRGG